MPKDFKCGDFIDCYGRKIFLYDCDPFTREFYKTWMDLDQTHDLVLVLVQDLGLVSAVLFLASPTIHRILNVDMSAPQRSICTFEARPRPVGNLKSMIWGTWKSVI